MTTTSMTPADLTGQSSRRGRHQVNRVLSRLALRLVVPAVLLVAWWVLAQTEKGQLFVATPLEAFQQTYADFFFDKFASDLLPSVWRAAQGFALAVVSGVAFGVALGRNAYLMATFQPLIHLGRSLPTPALLGVFFFLFGTGDEPKIFLIAFTVVWPILFNTIDGVTSVGEVRLQAAAVFKFSWWDRLTGIILPGAAPKIFAGMRTAMSLSLIVMIISELQKSTNGLGYLLVQSQRNFDYAGFWSVLIVLAILGVLANFLFTTIERRVLAWHRGATQHHD